MNLTKTEMNLIASLLDRAAGDCEDMARLDDLVEMTDAEKRDLDKEIEEYNSSPEDHDPEGDHEYQADFMLMYYFADKLRDHKGRR